MYDDEQADINAKIEYECNIVEYMLKPTETNNRTHFLFHPDLYSTYNYQSPHDLILGTSIKAHLSNLGGTTLDCLNYPSLTINKQNVNDANSIHEKWTQNYPNL
jgi:hypothetical protein